LLDQFLLAVKKRYGPKIYYPGVWVKGPDAGDTLLFMKVNNKNILRYNMSFNPAYPFYQDVEYKYENGTLSLMLYSPADQNFYALHSFTWRQAGKVFDIQGSELFAILSSTTVRYTYHKL
jgi:hypothetical protein